MNPASPLSAALVSRFHGDLSAPPTMWQPIWLRVVDLLIRAPREQDNEAHRNSQQPSPVHLRILCEAPPIAVRSRAAADARPLRVCVFGRRESQS